MTMLSLAAVLAESARRYPDKVAVVDRDSRITYADLWRQALAYAGNLRAHGVRPGDTVALLAPNVADFPRAYFGILAAGATVVPVHLLLTPAEMAYVLRDSGATLLVAETSQLDSGTAAAAEAGIPVVSVGPAGPNPLTGAGGDPAADLREPRSRGHRGHLLHERHHRRAERCRTHSPQPGHERDGERLRRQQRDP